MPHSIKSRAMSKENLPEKINPYRFAEARNQLHGVLHVKDMSRLRQSLADDSGEIKIDLQFGVDEQGISFLRGQLETQLTLQCQRCMETFVYEIVGNFLSGIVKSEEEAKELPEIYEPVIAAEGELVIQDMIEDELIVSLPIVPRHDLKACNVQSSKVMLGSEKELEEDNPFKVIEFLRVKRDTNRNQK
jgi:uncharacterized protein